MFINQVLFHYENVSSFLFDFLGCNIVSQLSKCLKFMTFWKRCLKTCIAMHVLK